MKKITAILLSALLVLSLAGCGNNSQNTAGDVSTETETAALAMESGDGGTKESTEESADAETTNNGTENTEAPGTADAGNGNILIAYFSVMETDGVDTVWQWKARFWEITSTLLRSFSVKRAAICFPSKQCRIIRQRMILSWSLLIMKKQITQDRSLRRRLKIPTAMM